MDAFVLDVSACMPWCCEDETTEASEQMLEWAMDGSAFMFHPYGLGKS